MLDDRADALFVDVCWRPLLPVVIVTPLITRPLAPTRKPGRWIFRRGGVVVSPEVLESKAWKRPGRVAARFAMSGFDQPVKRLPSCAPSLPVWRIYCRCRFRAGNPGEIAACGC